jgi:uncharacterized protein (DUF1501 family)
MRSEPVDNDLSGADCEPCRISRRALIKGAGAVTTVAVAVPALGSAAFASTNATRVGDVIINVFLRGAMDGLSVVVPRNEGAGANSYVAARPSIAVDPAAALALNGDLGLHPAMGALMPLWNAGNLALIPTAGFPDNDRSHFTVQRQMDFGAGSERAASGWLARHLNGTPSTDPEGVRAATIPYGQRSMQGSTVSVTMGSVESFRVNGFTGSGGMAQAALRTLHGGDSIVDQRARQAIDALDLVAAAPITAPANGAMYPATGRGRRFGESMRQIAQLIRADVGLEAAATEANLGWDLHSELGTYTSGNMREAVQALSEVLAAFAVDLGPLMDKVTVVVMTEFGRTFRENGNGGTDHGRASTMFVAGGGIRGGLYGTWPGLADADIDRNALRVTVDYRSVLADIVEQRLANPALDQVFPGFVLPAERLNLANPVLGPSLEQQSVAPVIVVPPVEVAPAPPVAEEGPAPVTAGPGTYVWTSPDGGRVELDVPAPGDDADVVSIESVRTALGAGSATYVSARVDNSTGSSALVLPTVTVSNAAGAPLVLREAPALLDEWVAGAAASSDTASAVALAEALRGRSSVAAGASAHIVLVAAGAPSDIAAVRVGAGGSSVLLAQAAPDAVVELSAAEG